MTGYVAFTALIPCRDGQTPQEAASEFRNDLPDYGIYALDLIDGEPSSDDIIALFGHLGRAQARGHEAPKAFIYHQNAVVIDGLTGAARLVGPDEVAS